MFGWLSTMFHDAVRKRNWLMATVLLLGIALVVIIFLLVEDTITVGAKAGGGLMVDAFASFASWPLSPLAVALILFIAIVIIVGIMLIQENRRHYPPKRIQRYVSDAEIRLADWAENQRIRDIEGLDKYLKTRVTVQIE